MAKKKAEAPAAKPPSKKTQGFAIFDEELKRRADGAFAGEEYPNKAFRKHVIARMMAEVTDKNGKAGDTSLASASTMYNQAMKAAEADDPNLGLGRDPKVVRVKSKKTDEAPAAPAEAPETEEATA